MEFSADALAERFYNRDALAVTPQVESVEIVRIGIVGESLDRFFGALDRRLEAGYLFRGVVFQVGGIDS